ncbi:MAG: hypothetical protein J0I12_27240 [Candidatus Eremiobacteraeota bacterium]|nr:hypothetical protein [Candidatus Eremiobacteraeota bacterium]
MDFVDGIDVSLRGLGLAPLPDDCKFIQEGRVVFRRDSIAFEANHLLERDEAARLALDGGPSWVNVTVLSPPFGPQVVVFSSGSGVGCSEPAYMAGREFDSWAEKIRYEISPDF